MKSDFGHKCKMKRLTVKDMSDGSRTIVSKNGGGETLAALNEQRQEKLLCDITLKVGDGVEILAHKNILVANSPYFRAMFLEGFSETQAREISLQAESVDARSVQALIDFMYSCQLPLTADMVQGVITVANLWQMTEVKMMSEEYMERLIDEENCLGISRFGEVYNCQRLVQRSEQLLKQRFPLVAQGTEFLQLSPSALLHIFSLNDLALGSEGEDVVARALCRWLDSQGGKLPPTDILTPLLHSVHWSATSPSCRKQLLSHPVLFSDAEVRQQLEAEGGRGMAMRVAQITLYVIGGYLQARTGPKCPRLQSVERLDPITSRWTPCAPLPVLSSASVALNLHSHLLVCTSEPITLGNRTTTTATRTDVYEYFPMRDEWVEAADRWSPEAMERVSVCLQAEGAVATCGQSRTIYAVSNQEASAVGFSVLEGSVYCRNARLLPRPHAHFAPQQRHFAAVVVDRRLYVMGGDRHDAGTDPVPTAMVITFDPERKEWLSRTNMLEPRVQLAAATQNGKIYVCGGFNTQRLSSVEIYDPVADQWTALNPMRRFRSHHQLLALNFSLWAIGGKSYTAGNGGARKVVNVCEEYCLDSKIWRELEEYSMKNARCAFAAVAI